MNISSLKKALVAGVAGTVIMTIFAHISQYIHLPRFDFHGLLSAHLGTGGTASWVALFAFGVALAYAYGAYFRTRLPAHSWSRGIVYAAILWAVMEAVLMPVLGMGFFSGSIATAVAAFAGMALYGATVGYMYERS